MDNFYTMTWLTGGDFQYEYKGIPQFTVNGNIDLLLAVQILRAMNLFQQVYPEGSCTDLSVKLQEAGVAPGV